MDLETTCAIVVGLGVVALFVSGLTFVLESLFEKAKLNQDANIKVYKDEKLVLEYTGKKDSIETDGKGYQFTAGDKTLYFDTVDRIEITEKTERKSRKK